MVEHLLAHVGTDALRGVAKAVTIEPAPLAHFSIGSHGGAQGQDAVEQGKFLGAERDAEGALVLVEAVRSGGAGDRHHVVTAVEHPSERELGGRDALHLSEATLRKPSGISFKSHGSTPYSLPLARGEWARRQVYGRL